MHLEPLHFQPPAVHRPLPAGTARRGNRRNRRSLGSPPPPTAAARSLQNFPQLRNIGSRRPNQKYESCGGGDPTST